MCERARRHLEPTFPLEGKRYFPRGPQIFYHGQHCNAPHWPVWRILGISFGFYCAGLKGASPGPEQLVRFWDIRVVAIGIIQRSHDPGPLLSPTDPNCRVRPGLCKTQKARETRGLHTAMGHGVPSDPIALIGLFGYFSLIGLDCTSSASALNTCTLSPAYPLFGWVTYGLWCYTL